MNESITELNRQFSLPNRVEIVEGHGGLALLKMSYDEALVELYLQGAHITRYQVKPDIDVLWMSNSTVYEQGRPIRGGIPLCWPWFGAHPEYQEYPQHGYARQMAFSVVSTHADADSTSVVLSLTHEAVERETTAFPDVGGKLDLEVEIRLSDSLWMEMRTRNVSSESVLVGAALHSYFAIANRNSVEIPEVLGLSYLDKPNDFRQYEQTSPLSIEGEVDRIYLSALENIQLIDREKQSLTQIQSWGNSDLVVWNPGELKAKDMGDFDDSGFEKMVCIEPAIALDKRKALQPGETHRLGQIIHWSLLENKI